MATLTLHTQKTLNQAAITAGTAKLVEYGKVLSHGAADTLKLPLSAEQGFYFILSASAAAIVTAAADTGETLVGETTTAAAIGSSILFHKTSSTQWTGSFVTGGAVVA